MARRWWPNPEILHASGYRRAREEWDRRPVGRYERAGFGSGDGYQGAYTARPAYRLPRGRLRPPEPQGSGWPAPVWQMPAAAEERHLRALADRDLARAVDPALYNVIGREADRLAVYADGAVITLEGEVPDDAGARQALETARRMPGVRRVRSALYGSHE